MRGGGHWREERINSDRYGCILLLLAVIVIIYRDNFKRVPLSNFSIVETARKLPRDEEVRWKARIYFEDRERDRKEEDRQGEIEKEEYDREIKISHPGIIAVYQL